MLIGSRGLSLNQNGLVPVGCLNSRRLVNFYQIQKEKKRKTRRVERRQHVTPIQHAYVESRYFIILYEVA